MTVSLWRTVKIFLVFRMQKNITSFSFNNVDKVWTDQIIQNIFFFTLLCGTRANTYAASAGVYCTFFDLCHPDWRGVTWLGQAVDSRAPDPTCPLCQGSTAPTAGKGAYRGVGPSLWAGGGAPFAQYVQAAAKGGRHECGKKQPI